MKNNNKKRRGFDKQKLFILRGINPKTAEIEMDEVEEAIDMKERSALLSQKAFVNFDDIGED